MSEIPQPRDDADPPAIGAAGLERPGWVSLLPRAAADPLATAFLRHLEVRGLSRNTLLAYGRALESLIELVGPLDELRLDANCVHRFLSHLRQTPSRQPSARGRRLSHSTMRQRVVGLRAYADYLVDCGHLDRNPVTRGRIRRTPEGEVIAVRRGLVPSAYRVPRLPTDEQWSRLLNSLHSRPVRDRLMFTLAYDGALRRNELVTLRLDDFDFAAQQVTIRAEHAKSGYQRTIVYSAPTCDLLRLYLPERRKLFPETHFLFLSGSPRNRSKPLGGYTWGLLAAALAREADVPGFSTHTLRHLRLTYLARAGLGITEIAKFAGHRSTETTMTYIHLSGRDLARAFDRASRVMAERFGRL
jgi:integrase/recombinase XerD